MIDLQLPLSTIWNTPSCTTRPFRLLWVTMPLTVAVIPTTFTQLTLIWPLTLPPAALSSNVARPEFPLALTVMCSTELPKVTVPLPLTDPAATSSTVIATVEIERGNMRTSRDRDGGQTGITRSEASRGA